MLCYAWTSGRLEKLFCWLQTSVEVMLKYFRNKADTKGQQPFLTLVGYFVTDRSILVDDVDVQTD